MEIFFNKHGDSLGTRTQAKQIRNEIFSFINKGQKVVLNFDDIVIVSNSFVDELIGIFIFEKSFDYFKENISISKANESVKAIIKKVVLDRINMAHQKYISH